MKINTKRKGSLLLALVMAASLATSALAASFSAPTKPLSTEDNVIRVTASRAGQVAPLILGCNLVAGTNIHPVTEDGKVGIITGTFGTDANAKPDPYLYNHNYNEQTAKAKGLPLVENATIAADQQEATAADPDNVLAILTHRPHLILNQAPGTGSAGPKQNYVDMINTLPENTDQDKSNDYDPSFYTCSISTLVYQCDNLINLSKAVNEICEKEQVKARYGDPYVIATDADKFVWGHYFYIQEQLAKGKIAKKTVAVLGNTEDNGANWVLPAMGQAVDQKKPNRLVEYVRDNANTLNGLEEISAPLAEVLKADVVIAYREGAGELLRSAAAAAGVKEAELPVIIDSLPKGIYGLYMQAHDNLIGIPFIQSFLYGEELGLNPVYAAAYFYQNFFHITDAAALQETVTMLLGEATLPKNVTTTLNKYDPKAIEELVVEGIRYAVTHGLKRHDDPEAWNPDLTVGLGKGFLPFTDLGEDWYKEAVKYVYTEHLFNGTTVNSFNPQGTMTRAMAVTVLYRLAGEPKVEGETAFTDLTKDWYKDAVAWASQMGITTGTTATTFSPYGEVTLQQFVTFLSRYAVKEKGLELPEAKADAYEGGPCAPWAEAPMTWAVSQGLLKGIQGSAPKATAPTAPVTRAQIALLLMNYAG